MRYLIAAIALLVLMSAGPAPAAEPLSKQSCFDPHYFCPIVPETRDYSRYDHTSRAVFHAPARGSDWHPQDWIVQRESPAALINGFYDSGILSAQYTNDKGMKTLEVGPQFYHLSRRDQRRVAQVISYLYRPGTYYLSDWYSRDIIASYTPRHGLMRE